ncbi:MAG: hypothetical protein JXR64_02605 [Spirochaetales bacterium]|nr:hypothetical protein [Spirochaetales bacterium]
MDVSEKSKPKKVKSKLKKGKGKPKKGKSLESESFKSIKPRLKELKEEIENPIGAYPPRLGDLPLQSGVISSYAVSPKREITLQGKKVQRSFVTFNVENENMPIVSTFVQSVPELVNSDVEGKTLIHDTKWTVKIVD